MNDIPSYFKLFCLMFSVTYMDGLIQFSDRFEKWNCHVAEVCSLMLTLRFNQNLGKKSNCLLKAPDVKSMQLQESAIVKLFNFHLSTSTTVLSWNLFFSEKESSNRCFIIFHSFCANRDPNCFPKKSIGADVLILQSSDHKAVTIGFRQK